MDMQQALQQALGYLQSGPPEKCLAACNEILAGNPELIPLSAWLCCIPGG